MLENANEAYYTPIFQQIHDQYSFYINLGNVLTFMAYKKINKEIPESIQNKISDFVKNKDLLSAEGAKPVYDLKVVKELITTYREFLVDFIKKYDPSFLELINTAIQELTTQPREINKTEINKIVLSISNHNTTKKQLNDISTYINKIQSSDDIKLPLAQFQPAAEKYIIEKYKRKPQLPLNIIKNENSDKIYLQLYYKGDVNRPVEINNIIDMC